MKVLLLTITAVAMVAGLVYLVLWLHGLWKQGGKDSASLVGTLAAGLIIGVFILWGFHLPSWIGENYFGTGDLKEELRTACVLIHNYTRLAETDHCKELASGEDTIFYVGRNEYRVPNVPSCGQNEVIVGTGTYEDGYWTDYACSRE